MESKWVWPFELLDKLGEGGMGVVYRARYVGNNRQVAVKLIPNDVTANPTLLARFERELEVLKQLTHPNIVHCFGGRCESKQRFYAMEYVSGGTLSDFLHQKGELAWETAVDFAIQMCDGLQYAHERGITHRDVKPGNFLLTDSGQLKLSDFGLASIVSQGRLTAAGRTVGTILYMSPEQIRGEPVSPKVDLYGLGCVIFEMISGNPPYTGNNAGDVLQQHLKAPIPHLIRSAPECPLELDELVCELLAKEPDQRPASASDVATRLNGILLPSRRVSNIEPSFFSSIPPKAVATIPMKRIDSRLSEVLPRFVSSREKLLGPALWIATGLMTILCLWLASGWARTSFQLRQAEETWIVLLETSEPESRIVAARALAKFAVLSRSTIDKLRLATMSPNVDVRLAALQTLKKHAVESRSVQGELFQLQKADENPSVRAEAGMVITAIQQSGRSISLTSLAFLGILLVLVAGMGLGAWWIWKRAKLITG